MGLIKLAKGWRKGAVKGNAKDQHMLAYCYDNGLEGVKRDQVAAAWWYGKAADKGHAEAQASLGVCYEDGEGVEVNRELATMWFRKAAEQNNAGGQFNLGQCYALGEGVEQDDALAVAWWKNRQRGAMTVRIALSAGATWTARAAFPRTQCARRSS